MIVAPLTTEAGFKTPKKRFNAYVTATMLLTASTQRRAAAVINMRVDVDGSVDPRSSLARWLFVSLPSLGPGGHGAHGVGCGDGTGVGLTVPELLLGDGVGEGVDGVGDGVGGGNGAGATQNKVPSAPVYDSAPSAAREA